MAKQHKIERMPETPTTRRRFLQVSGLIAAGMGSKAHAAKTKLETFLEAELQRWEKEEKARKRKKLEPELIEDIRGRMQRILLNTNKIPEIVNKLTKTPNPKQARENYRKELFQRIDRSQVGGVKEATAELESTIVFLKYFIFVEGSTQQPEEYIQNLKNTREFLITLRNPAYEKLYKKIESQENIGRALKDFEKREK